MPPAEMRDEPAAISARGDAHAVEAITRGRDSGKGPSAMPARRSARSASYPGALPSRRRSRPRTRWQVHGDRPRRHSRSKCLSAPHALLPPDGLPSPLTAARSLSGLPHQETRSARNQCVKITRIGQRPTGAANVPAAGQARGGAGCVGCQVLPDQRRERSDPKATRPPVPSRRSRPRGSQSAFLQLKEGSAPVRHAPDPETPDIGSPRARHDGGQVTAAASSSTGT